MLANVIGIFSIWKIMKEERREVQSMTMKDDYSTDNSHKNVTQEKMHALSEDSIRMRITRILGLEDQSVKQKTVKEDIAKLDISLKSMNLSKKMISIH